MKKSVSFILLALMLAFGANAVWAAPYTTNLNTDAYDTTPDGIPTPNSVSFGAGEPEIFDTINLLLSTNYTHNSQVDHLQYLGDKSVWGDMGSAGYAVIGLGAGNFNALEVYDVNTPGTKINVFQNGGYSGSGFTGDGTIGNPYIGTASVLSEGTQFGFALQSTDGIVSTWDSNPLFNPDGMDHIMAYNLSALMGTQIYVYDPVTDVQRLVTLNNPYLLAFEDTTLANNGIQSDQDYNDTMFLVDRVSPTVPVPEPMTVALMAFGLLATGVVGLRRKEFRMVS